MATLKESNFSGTNGQHFKIKLDMTYTQDTTLNKTYIRLWNNFVSMDGYSGSGSANSVSAYVNDTLVGRTDSIGANQTKMIGYKDIEISHNADGTFPNTNYSASIQTTWSLGSASVSGTITSQLIPKINRASTWNVGTLNLNDVSDEFELQINQYVSDYHNVVTITNANKTIVIRTINDAINGTTVQFNATELSSLYTMDTNTTINPIKFYLNLYTYDSNNNQIGNVQTIIGYGGLTNPEPTLSATTTEQNSKVVNLPTTKIVNYVSILKFNITATPQYSATISSVSVDGTPATYNSTTQKYEVTLSNLTGAWVKSFQIIATDSRGISTTITLTKNVANYKPIAINTWSIERASQTSNDLVLNVDAVCYSSNVDDKQNPIKVTYSTDNTNWVEIPSSSYIVESNTLTITNLTLSNVISYQTHGTFYLKISDKLTVVNDNKDIAVGIYTFAKGDRKVRINGTLEIADSNGENRVNILKTYSTDETQIGFWIDDKPLYRRIITGTKVSGTNLMINTNWVSDIDTLARFDGTLRSISNYNYPLNFYAQSGNYSNLIMNRVEKHISVVSSTGNYSNGDVIICVEYTKTTD